MSIQIIHFTLKAHSVLSKSHINNITGHFVWIHNKKYRVFTSSSKIKGTSCTKISDTNIKGQEIPQYISNNAHDWDSELHIGTITQQCLDYLEKNHEILISLVTNVPM